MKHFRTNYTFLTSAGCAENQNLAPEWLRCGYYIFLRSSALLAFSNMIKVLQMILLHLIDV